MTPSQPTPYSYLIVGSGVFGASTAYHLSKTHPKASIALIDRSESYPCELAASHDINKIVRADYGNEFYCKLALEAREAWVKEEMYKPYFHQSGMVVLDDTGLGKKIITNYQTLKAHSESVIIDVNEMKSRYDGLFEDADYRGVEEVFINPLSGWAEATRAVRKVIETGVSSGVKYISGDVKKLLFNENGACIGVQTKYGDQILAQKIILSTGSGTAKLLADSAPDRPSIQAEDRITAAAVVTGVLRFRSKVHESVWSKAPVFIHSVGKVQGEVLALTEDGLLKFCVDVSFKNTSLHKASGQMISAPPDEPHQGQHDVPQSLKDECRRVVKGIYGERLEHHEFDSFRICWDGITPNQDFIISDHPRCKNLYVATGGSFHGWKFLPIIGKYVVKMLEGTLEQDLSSRWAWDRDQLGNAHEKIIPQREFMLLESTLSFLSSDISQISGFDRIHKNRFWAKLVMEDKLAMEIIDTILDPEMRNEYLERAEALALAMVEDYIANQMPPSIGAFRKVIVDTKDNAEVQDEIPTSQGRKKLAKTAGESKKITPSQNTKSKSPRRASTSTETESEHESAISSTNDASSSDEASSQDESDAAEDDAEMPVAKRTKTTLTVARESGSHQSIPGKALNIPRRWGYAAGRNMEHRNNRNKRS
ncbi:hypothetical protein EG329_001423 [Mollisiaceae sp. DMI_Dod_QoI]|nr:hypothetical protein EG329_001423 [Helotiales sp. DMI_Dod_QoI]